jgi:hypothetical protein
MTLEQLAFVFFAAVALGGALMSGLIAAKLRVPRGLAPLHGLGGLAGVGLLLTANLSHAAATPRAWLALGVFAAGLAGGVLFFAILFPKRTPLPLIAAHGSLGAIGLYLLYRVAFAAA